MEGLGDVRERTGGLGEQPGSPGLSEDRVFALGRRLLENLGEPVVPAASGIPSAILPAGGFALLVLGIPIPVFSYMGDDNQALQRRVVDRFNAAAGGLLNGSHRVALHSFSRCFDRAPQEEILDLLPAFASLNGTRKASYLGVQMVTVLPLSERESSLWPHGPAAVRRCSERFKEILPEVYRQLDQDLVRMHQTRLLPGGRRALWSFDPPG